MMRTYVLRPTFELYFLYLNWKYTNEYLEYFKIMNNILNHGKVDLLGPTLEF